MRAIITIVGKNETGILARVTDIFWKNNVDVLDVTQTLVDDYFTTTMIVDLSNMEVSFEDFKEEVIHSMEHLEIHVMSEDIFDAMHEI